MTYSLLLDDILEEEGNAPVQEASIDELSPTGSESNNVNKTKPVETRLPKSSKSPTKKKKKMSNFEKGISMLCSQFNDASERNGIVCIKES